MVNSKVWAQCLFHVIANAISCERGDVISEMKSINFIPAVAVNSWSTIVTLASLQQQGKQKASCCFKEQPSNLCVNDVRVVWLRKIIVVFFCLFMFMKCNQANRCWATVYNVNNWTCYTHYVQKTIPWWQQKYHKRFFHCLKGMHKHQ